MLICPRMTRFVQRTATTEPSTPRLAGMINFERLRNLWGVRASLAMGRNSLSDQGPRLVFAAPPGAVVLIAPRTQLHLFKWAYKLDPFVPAELVADCFELAVEIRTLDMRASPYDLAELGYPPVRIETATGRAEYARGQGEFARRAAPLRHRLIAHCHRLVSAAP